MHYIARVMKTNAFRFDLHLIGLVFSYYLSNYLNRITNTVPNSSIKI